jgi:hypothetical protein
MKHPIPKCKGCRKPIELHRRGHAELCADCTWSTREVVKRLKEQKARKQYAERFA